MQAAASKRPRVLLADDHPLILEGLSRLLMNDAEVVGVSTNGREVVSEALRLRPDAVLLDVSMPLLNGFEAAKQIREQLPATKLLFVTQKADRTYVASAFALGASAYLIKQGVAGEVVVALHEVLAGRYYVSPSLQAHIPDALKRPNRNPIDIFGRALTTRQREVLQLVAEGKSIKEAAAILGVAVKTIDFHKAGIMSTLGLRTTAELTRYAIEQGIVENQAEYSRDPDLL